MTRTLTQAATSGTPRDRADLLRAIEHGLVCATASGVWRRTNGGMRTRIAAQLVRDVIDTGLAEVDHAGTYRLTDTGRAERASTATSTVRTGGSS